VTVDFGVQPPLMDVGGHPYPVEHLAEYIDTVARLGFSALAVAWCVDRHTSHGPASLFSRGTTLTRRLSRLSFAPLST
jgi:hypothetical protein